MTTLDINASGAWRTVIFDLHPSLLPQVREACLALTAASAAPGNQRVIGWRLSTPQGQELERCDARPSLGDPALRVAEWRPL